jgi:hypothetical protein
MYKEDGTHDNRTNNNDNYDAEGTIPIHRQSSTVTQVTSNTHHGVDRDHENDHNYGDHNDICHSRSSPLCTTPEPPLQLHPSLPTPNNTTPVSDVTFSTTFLPTTNSDVDFALLSSDPATDSSRHPIVSHSSSLTPSAFPHTTTNNTTTNDASITTTNTTTPRKEKTYFQVVYRGIVALLAEPPENLTVDNHKRGNTLVTKTTGHYLSYGEIFSGSCLSENPTWIRVEEILTGGYALDATPYETTTTHNANEIVTVSTQSPHTTFESKSEDENDNNNNNNDDKSDDMDHHSKQQQEQKKSPLSSEVCYGFIPRVRSTPQASQFFHAHGSEETRITTLVKELEYPPIVERGEFRYQVIATNPLPILTGPLPDAPRTQAAVLPGDTPSVELRVQYEPHGVAFLKLRHWRGYIADHYPALVVDSTKQQQPTVVLMPKVNEVLAFAAAASDGPNTSINDDNHSMGNNSSSVLSEATTTASSFTAVSMSSSCLLSRTLGRNPRRHRPPRKEIDNNKRALPPRQITNNKQFHPQQFVHQKNAGDNTYSSNVSILSDDSSLDMRVMTQQHANPIPTSPDHSHSTSKSLSSTSNTHHINTTSEMQQQQTFYLLRVTAPRGLKILDAPQLQVTNFIRHNNKYQSNKRPPTMKTVNHHSIFQTMHNTRTTSSTSVGLPSTASVVVFDAHTKSRILPRNAIFEASSRLVETSTALSAGSFLRAQGGTGLIKLADGSGWAVVPQKEDLDQQYRNYHFSGSTSKGTVVKEGEATRAYEEVGSAISTVEANINSLSLLQQVPNSSTTWLRVVSRIGVTVVCPPPPPAEDEEDNNTSPTSSRGSSSGVTASTNNHGVPSANNSDVASSVGSGFLDAMFRGSPLRKKDAEIAAQDKVPRIEKVTQESVIPCGMFLEVEPWADPPPNQDAFSSREYVRLRGGQGWVPLQSENGKPTTTRVVRPDLRFGSFWFRVQSSRGIKVRLGPSRRAPSIKSEDGMYFRFECGEFLRASEVITIFSDNGEPVESFAKLYRNRHVRMHATIGHDDYRPLPCLTTQAEWVQVYFENELFLEECGEEPRIERHKQGWRYNVVPEDGIAVRKGPSFAAEKTGIILFGGESVVINERVIPPGTEKITWLRMKDGQGWIHDLNDEGQTIVIAHSLRHRTQLTNRPRKPAIPTTKDGNEIAYNTIIARLFHNDSTVRNDDGRRRDFSRKLQR